MWRPIQQAHLGAIEPERDKDFEGVGQAQARGIFIIGGRAYVARSNLFRASGNNEEVATVSLARRHCSVGVLRSSRASRFKENAKC